MESTRTEDLLAEIRDIQKQALQIQERTSGLIERQYQRAEKLQDRAEAIQERSASMVRYGKRLFLVITPILLALVVYVSWLLFVKLRY